MGDERPYVILDVDREEDVVRVYLGCAPGTKRGEFDVWSLSTMSSYHDCVVLFDPRKRRRRR